MTESTASEATSEGEAVARGTACLVNKYGLHARPATLFAETANRFAADIKVHKDDLVVNGKSIFGIMTLGAEMGTELVIEASGEDAREAVAALQELVSHKFGEE